MKKRIVLFLILIFYKGVIFYLSSRPIPYTFKIERLDFFLHLIEYLPLSILWILCLKELKIRKIFIFSFIFSFLYAISDEIHQIFIPGRVASLKDLIADLVGITLGIFIFKKWRR